MNYWVRYLETTVNPGCIGMLQLPSRDNFLSEFLTLGMITSKYKAVKIEQLNQNNVPIKTVTPTNMEDNNDLNTFNR